ncbi:MAG TPA: fumarylacetoacetate hydrolase family protein [Candidatus Kapabacteria bacterium]|nr:fumarylacetoacetate hydrolase family protein [Candidatus Kapabacteria bacterium]
MQIIFDVDHQEEYSIESGTIYCVGRNYVDHILELGNERPANPIIFVKPACALRHGSYNVIEYPPGTDSLEFEAELVLLLRGGGRDIHAYDPSEIIYGYGVGIDLTMRDLQTEFKNKGLPWTLAKGFDGSAQVSHFIPYDGAPPFENIGFSLFVNGELRQRGNTKEMIFSPEMMVNFLSQRCSLKLGDILFTGTPKGTGKLATGDKIVMQLHTQDPNVVLLDFHAEVIEWQ